MSLIDRVRVLAGRCTVQQARAAVAEIYRHVGEGAMASDDPENMARTLLDAARLMVQLNAAEMLDDVTPDATPEQLAGRPTVAELVQVDTSPDLVVQRCAVCGRALWQADTTTGKVVEHFVTEINWSSDGTRCADWDTCAAVAHYVAIEERLCS